MLRLLASLYVAEVQEDLDDKAPVLHNEVNRRETIRRYGALDTHAEQDCENVAPLAFHISWISLQGKA